MALGGGTYVTKNKVLPGSYINVVNSATTSATLSEKGYVAVPLSLDWGEDQKVFTVEAKDFLKESTKVFGYDYGHEKMKELRELFKHAKTAVCYRLNGGDKATATLGEVTATARYSGVRGNNLKVVITADVDDATLFHVTTLLDNAMVHRQVGKQVQDLQDNEFVLFTGTGALAASIGVELSGGTNKATVAGSDYQSFLDKVESFGFNILACPTSDGTVTDLFVQYTKRMRDENGVKFQTVVYRKEAADYEGVISVENTVTDAGANEAALVYWTAGLQAACPINQSRTNVTYDGEYRIQTNLKQTQLEQGLKAGKFLFHKVGDEVRILKDINTFTSYTVDKNEDFGSNQVIRVLDQVANDIAKLFNSRFLGKVQNNAAGRIAFWNELVTYNKELEKIQAIQNFDAKEVKVEQDGDQGAITVANPVQPSHAMNKLYMTVVVK